MANQRYFVTMPKLISMLIKYCDDKGLEYANHGELVCARMEEDTFLVLYYNPTKVVYMNGKPNYVYGALCYTNQKATRVLFAEDMEYIFKKLFESSNNKENGNKDKV